MNAPKKKLKAGKKSKISEFHEQLARALLKFHEQLSRAFAPNEKDDGSAEWKRAAYCKALVVIAEFSESITGNLSIATEFHSLAVALEDLDRGAVAWFLEPKAISHRKPPPTNLFIIRAVVALGIYTLIKGGKKRKEAARIAVASIPDLKRLRSGKATGTPQSVALSWYDEFKVGRVINPDAVRTFEDKRAQIDSQLTADNFDSVARQFFDNASSVLSHLGPTTTN
jgi:hypothetical protein